MSEYDDGNAGCLFISVIVTVLVFACVVVFLGKLLVKLWAW